MEEKEEKVVEKQKKSKSNTIFVAVVVCLIFLMIVSAIVVFYIGKIDSSMVDNNVTGDDSGIDDTDVVDDNDNGGVDVEDDYDDAVFLSWCRNYLEKYQIYSNNIRVNLEQEDWYDIAYWCNLKMDSVENAKSEVWSFTLSSKMGDVRYEFASFLNNDYLSTYYLLEACDCMTGYPVDYVSATGYLNKSTMYTYRAIDNLNNIKSILNRM